MEHDPWLIKLAEALRQAKSREQILAVMDRLEDHYDAFSEPGQDMVEELLAEARRRLSQFAGGN